MKNNKPEFKKHILDAIAINKKHLADYTNLFKKNNDDKYVSDLRSIFRQLIFSEILLVPTAAVCDLIMPKAMSCAFADMTDKKIELIKTATVLANPDLKKYLILAKSAARKSDYQQLHKLTYELINELQCQYTNCMLRHILESFLRSISIYKSDDFLTGSEKKLFKIFCHSHLLLIQPSHKIDLKAFAIQKLGYPILSSELPSVPDFNP